MTQPQLVTAPTPVARDRYGRPLINTPGRATPKPYTRATTLAGTLDDLYGLMAWKQRQTAIGLADRKDLLLSVAAHRDDKKTLNAVCEQALEASQAGAAATTGTALHSLTELVDTHQDLPVLPDDAAADLAAYQQAMAPFTVVAIEQMVVLDELEVAGTPDRIVQWSGQHFIFDLKTGRTLDFSAGKIAMQLALYSRGVGYDPSTGTRYDLPDVNQNAAIVMHVPAGTGTAHVRWVDIKSGWHAVHLALNVREWRKRRDLILPF